MTETSKNGGSYLFSGITGLVISCGAGYFAQDFPFQGIQEGLGAAFFPFLIIGLISIFSLGQIVYGLSIGFETRSPFSNDSDLKSVFLLFLLFVLFTVAFSNFGLIIPTILFLILAIKLLGASWRMSMLVGALAGISIFAVFVVGFGIPMPS